MAGIRWRRLRSFSFVDRLATSGKVIESSRELIIKAWSVPAAETARYGELVGKIHQNLLNIWARERFGRIRPPGPNWLAAVLALVFLFVLFGFLGSLTSNVPERGKAGLRPAGLHWTELVHSPSRPCPFRGKVSPARLSPRLYPPDDGGALAVRHHHRRRPAPPHATRSARAPASRT